MKKQFINLSADLQASTAEDRWIFKGYASVFGSGNDRGFSIAPGAFSDVIQSGAIPSMFFNHDRLGVPVGRWLSLAEDGKGLKVEGELSKRVSQSSDIHGALLDGLITGLSIGIVYDPEDMKETDGKYSLHRVAELPEISLVTFPSDPEARVAEVLSADEIDEAIDRIQSVRDFDGFLRDAAGLSRRQAKRLVASVKTALTAEIERDARDQRNAAAFKRLNDAISNL